MKTKGTILIIEPERIIGWEIRMELENKGYSVLQSPNVKHSVTTGKTAASKVVIINVDTTGEEDIVYLKENLSSDCVHLIAISSAFNIPLEYQDIKFEKTFYKPFDSKRIVQLVEECIGRSAGQLR